MIKSLDGGKKAKGEKGSSRKSAALVDSGARELAPPSFLGHVTTRAHVRLLCAVLDRNCKGREQRSQRTQN